MWLFVALSWQSISICVSFCCPNRSWRNSTPVSSTSVALICLSVCKGPHSYLHLLFKNLCLPLYIGFNAGNCLQDSWLQRTGPTSSKKTWKSNTWNKNIFLPPLFWIFTRVILFSRRQNFRGKCCQIFCPTFFTKLFICSVKFHQVLVARPLFVASTNWNSSSNLRRGKNSDISVIIRIT